MSNVSLDESWLDESSEGSIFDKEDNIKLKLTRHGHIIPRPNNCFLVYRRDISLQLKDSKEFPNSRAISKLVAQLWRTESDAVKLHYRELARKEKQIHQLQYPDYKYRPKKRAKTFTDIGVPEVPDSSLYRKKRKYKYKSKQNDSPKQKKTTSGNQSYTDYEASGLDPDPIKQIVLSELKDRINDLVSQGAVKITKSGEQTPDEQHSEQRNFEENNSEDKVTVHTTATTSEIKTLLITPSDIFLDLKKDQNHTCLKTESPDGKSNDTAPTVVNANDANPKQMLRSSIPKIVPSSSPGMMSIYEPDISLDEAHFSFKPIEPVAESHLLLEDEALLIQDDPLDDASEGSEEACPPLSAITNAANALIESLEVVNTCLTFYENSEHDLPIIQAAAVNAITCLTNSSQSIAGSQISVDYPITTTPSLSTTSNSSQSGDEDNEEADFKDSFGSSTIYIPELVSSPEHPEDSEPYFGESISADLLRSSPISIAALRLHELISSLPHQLLMQKLDNLSQDDEKKIYEQIQQQEQSKMDWSLDEYINVE
ncbi:hypothetical protein INT43_005531 [Umbelopsis isabellina]|uniref:HMG box domain-containing protein n=1 Tax=Mortierella isabellina TaxID=91625 RepID=A0A8H7PLN1_MORIS|nr:hypothetical protein INT43_005531 [Umbelopsis isabellina]